MKYLEKEQSVIRLQATDHICARKKEPMVTVPLSFVLSVNISMNIEDVKKVVHRITEQHTDFVQLYKELEDFLSHQLLIKELNTVYEEHYTQPSDPSN